MYGELAEWFPLLSPPEEYVEEAALYVELLSKHSPVPRSVLELGSGAGSNAVHMKKHFELTLTDLSDDMLAVGRKLNPECVHVQGDMKTIRLGETFDGVFVHDAICYMTTEAELRQVFETVFVHCAPGGVALIAPDWVKETFRPGTDDGGVDSGTRGLRYFEWIHDPDPGDTTYTVDYAVMLRSDDGVVRVEHERHVEGIFPQQTWVDSLTEAGFEVEVVPDPIEAGRVLFVGRKV